jgi:hypothetical protein
MVVASEAGYPAWSIEVEGDASWDCAFIVYIVALCCLVMRVVQLHTPFAAPAVILLLRITLTPAAVAVWVDALSVADIE